MKWIIPMPFNQAHGWNGNSTAVAPLDDYQHLNEHRGNHISC